MQSDRLVIGERLNSMEAFLQVGLECVQCGLHRLLENLNSSTFKLHGDLKCTLLTDHELGVAYQHARAVLNVRVVLLSE